LRYFLEAAQLFSSSRLIQVEDCLPVYSDPIFANQKKRGRRDSPRSLDHGGHLPSSEEHRPRVCLPPTSDSPSGPAHCLHTPASLFSAWLITASLPDPIGSQKKKSQLPVTPDPRLALWSSEGLGIACLPGRARRSAEFVSSGKFLLGAGVIADLRLLVLEVCCSCRCLREYFSLMPDPFLPAYISRSLYLLEESILPRTSILTEAALTVLDLSLTSCCCLE
jgi:hypothetical protein